MKHITKDEAEERFAHENPNKRNGEEMLVSEMSNNVGGSATNHVELVDTMGSKSAMSEEL